MFIQNVGQFAPGARFQMWGGLGTTWLADDAIWITLLERPAISRQLSAGDPGHKFPLPLAGEGQGEGQPRKGVNLKLSFAGANPHPRLEPYGRLETKVSYFIGADPGKWHPDVPVWGGVRYVDLYPGIDLVIGADPVGADLVFAQGGRSQGSPLPWWLVVREGAALQDVRLRIEGAEAVELLPSLLSGRGAAGEGQLRVTTAVGDLILPLLTLEGPGPDGEGELSALSLKPQTLNPTPSLFEVSFPFAPGEDDAQGEGPQPLSGASDLLYATFLGGSSSDDGAGIAVDGTGQAYVTGGTLSTDFPAADGPGYDTNLDGNGDAFVAKLDASGTGLVYATFLGGVGADDGSDIAVNGTGQAYVTGRTGGGGFPADHGPGYDTGYHGSHDAFVVKLSAGGTSIVYATYLGGTAYDEGYDIAIDGAGRAYVTGLTVSSDFPATNGPGYDTTFRGAGDAFAVRLSADGMTLGYATFLGGSSWDYGEGIAVDGAGRAYVTGLTVSSDFPAANGPGYDTTFRGAGDAFVVRLSADGMTLAYATFLGGSNGLLEYGFGVAVDSAGAAYITGKTDASDFPATNGPGYDTSHNGDYDAFLVKLNPAGTALAYATFLGGAAFDAGNGLAVDGSGNAYVAGETASSGFPTTSGAYNGGSSDAFVAKLATGSGGGPTYAFSGRVVDAEGSGLRDVTLSDGIGHSIVTAGDGSYVLSGLPAGTYTISPQEAGYAFSPRSVTRSVPPSRGGTLFRAGALTITAITVTQAIGNQFGGSRFVAGKPTAVRVRLSSDVDVDPEKQTVDVRRDGAYVTTLKPSKVEPGVLTFLCQAGGDCRWVAGNYTFDTTVNGISAQTTATFEERKGLRVLAVPVKVNDRGVVKQVGSTQITLENAGRLLRKVYPVASGSIFWVIDLNELDATLLPLNTEIGQGLLTSALSRRQPHGCQKGSGQPCYDEIIGFIPPMPIGCGSSGDDCDTGFTHGAPSAVVMVNGTFSLTVTSTVYYYDIVYMQQTVAHEVSHNYGLGDEYACGKFECSVNPAPSAYKSWTLFGCSGGGCSDPTVAAYLGKTWGSKVSVADDPFDVTVPAEPQDKLSFMGGPNRPENDIWVTPRIYARLFGAFAPSAERAALQDTGSILRVSGLVAKDGSLSLDPWYHYTGAPPAVVSGTYTIEAVDALSQTLASQGFDVSFVALSDPPKAIDPAPFATEVSFPGETSALRIKHGDAVLSVVPVSPNAPVITVTAPTTGEVVSGLYAIAWQSADLDGDTLYHSVEYAHDGRQWLVLASDITGTQHVANFDALPGGDQARIRVIVSDGVNTVEATSAPFVTVPKPPSAGIEGPLDGAHYAWGDIVVLCGGGYDPQEGELRSESALAWSSDRDGLLGRGDLLNVGGLSVGSHTIILSATNSLSMTVASSETLTIDVPSTGLALDGPTQGGACFTQPFTASVAPVSSTVPLTYVWQATGQAPVTHTSALSDTVAFTWCSPGAKTVTVAAMNAVGVVTSTQALTISAPSFVAPTSWSTSYRMAQGWTSQDRYPRLLADVDGDGRADVVGFGHYGTYVSLSTGTAFDAGVRWLAAFGYAQGWTSQDRYPRLLADVDGDGRADVVGFGRYGAMVALSTRTSFAPPKRWIASFGYSVGGWISQSIFPRLLADVDGDGRADVVGFGKYGAMVALSTGASFAPPERWVANFGYSTGGWTSQDLFPRLLADVDGDGRADVVGFGKYGAFVSVSSGTSFTSPTRWIAGYGASVGGWTSQNLYPRTLGDVNGDGREDIVGFGHAGAFISLSTGAAFVQPYLGSGYFGRGTSAGGWTSQNLYPRTVADANHDHQADIVGFGAGGVRVSRSGW
jgi:hypothetical protein